MPALFEHLKTWLNRSHVPPAGDPPATAPTLAYEPTSRLCNGHHGSVIETGYILGLLQRLKTLRQRHRGAEPLDPFRPFRNRT